jgi:hypothetical protein
MSEDMRSPVFAVLAYALLVVRSDTAARLTAPPQSVMADAVPAR